MALSRKQQAFVEFYLVCWNASEAARRAGYTGKANVVGPRLLSNVSIDAAIKERLSELKMSADEALIRLSEMARANMRDFIDITADGKGFINLTKAAKKGKLHLIKEVEQVRDTRVIGEVEFIHETMRIKLHDQMAALQLIGKHHKLFSEKIVISDWRMEAIEAIRAGELPFNILAEELDYDLATELFRAAGIPVSREAGTGETEK